MIDEKALWFTNGPKTDKPEMAVKMIKSGATGVRLSMSYGDYKLKRIQAEMFRNAAREVDEEFDIIADVSGEKVKLGEFDGKDSVELSQGDTVELVSKDQDFKLSEMQIPLNSDILFGSLEKGDTIYIGDGDVLLRVESCDDSIICETIKSGTVQPFRGLKPQSDLFEPSALTDKDVEDLKFIAESKKFDAALISFVSSANDVERAKEILKGKDCDIPVISKIESKKGLENLEEICQASDAVMAARGDLALFLPWDDLGDHVERIAETAEMNDTKWILATQLLEGMERFPIPSRADICDVDHWKKEGASGFMLCYETAFGDKPTESMRALDKLVS